MELSFAVYVRAPEGSRKRSRWGIRWPSQPSKTVAPLIPVASFPRSLFWSVAATTNIWLCVNPAESNASTTLDWEKPTEETHETTTAFAPESFAASAAVAHGNCAFAYSWSKTMLSFL